MRLSTLLAASLLFFALAGCGDEEIAQPQLPQEPALSREESLVVANCYTLQEAVEAFAAGNNGEYPWDATTGALIINMARRDAFERAAKASNNAILELTRDQIT